MPDTRNHRGKGPEDAKLFGPESWVALRQATSDLCWLLNRGYTNRSATELVGNRYSLSARQRLAVARSACPEASARRRAERQVPPSKLANRELWLDGFNVLTGMEVALSGGIILVGQDQCCRDVAGVHRQYRKVEETIPALRLIGEFTARYSTAKCLWWLDKPVSNSGRLRSVILDVAKEAGWPWESHLVFSPDAVLSDTEHIVATSDSVILDRCSPWINLLRLIIGECIPQAQIVDLSLQEENILPGCVPAGVEQNCLR